METKIEVAGLQKTIRQLRNIKAAGPHIIEEVITDLVLGTHQFAVEGIQQGPASGRVYNRSNPTRVHQASARGEYPASDLGQLASSITFNLPTADRLLGEVGTNLLHGVYMELGTSTIVARPWLFPSVEKAKFSVSSKLKQQLTDAIKRAT